MFPHTALLKESLLCFSAMGERNVILCVLFSHSWSASPKCTSTHKQQSSWLRWEVRSCVRLPVLWSENVFTVDQELNWRSTTLQFTSKSAWNEPEASVRDSIWNWITSRGCFICFIVTPQLNWVWLNVHFWVSDNHVVGVSVHMPFQSSYRVHCKMENWS